MAFVNVHMQGQRTAARIGKGVAKKRAERDARATQEAIAAGMLKRKGLGRKKRDEAKMKGRKPGDSGLQELSGSFRNGVLKIAKPGSGGKPTKDRGSFRRW